MTSYIGVSDARKDVKDIYIGVNNVPKEVVRAYIGVNNVPKIVFEKDWWTIGGAVSYNNILAAYQFKNASSKSTAMTDLTGHGYNLSGSNVSWDANGIYSGYVTQGSLPSAGISTQVLYIGSYSMSSNDTVQSNDLLTWMKFPYLTTNCRFGYTSHGSQSGTVHHNGNKSRFGAITSWYGQDSSSGYYNRSICSQSGAGAQNGVVACSSGGAIWVNGSAQSTSTLTTTGWDGSNPPINNNTIVCNARVCRVYAAVFYNIGLSNDLHSSLYSKMVSI